MFAFPLPLDMIEFGIYSMNKNIATHYTINGYKNISHNFYKDK